VAVLVLGQALTVDRQVGGRWRSPCEGTEWYTADLRDRVAYARAHAGEVVLVLPAYGGERATWALPLDHLARMTCIRRDLVAVATTLGVRTVDLNEVLCPAGPAGPCGDLHEKDGTHVDQEDAPQVLDWLLDRTLSTVRG
jgi:hypothetical protein